MDDIIFVLPEDVSVVFDQYGKCCVITYITYIHMSRLRILVKTYSIFTYIHTYIHISHLSKLAELLDLPIYFFILVQKS